MNGRSVLLVLSGLILRINGQFPPYFFSQQNALSPPNCRCLGGQGQTINNNNNNNLPINNFPNQNFPINNFPNQNFPINNNFPNSINNFPSQNFPINSNLPNPINNFINYPNNNFPANTFPNNNNNIPGVINNQQPFSSIVDPNIQVDRQKAQQQLSGRGKRAAPTRRTMISTRAFGQQSMQVCGTDGNIYSDVCLIINAQSQNPSLGGRPCNLQAAVQSVQQGSTNNNFNQFVVPVCMNDGSTSPSADAALSLMLNNRALGIRCQGQCPCQLTCPPTNARDMQTLQQYITADCF
ncbi:hypothetical protein BV898_09235 [Hypsibius exemplaris]|uniref:Uncharacterized protein n=1 Tax=Hypsibius exemplaris TaxID=2072580 RepID=A0A1W0WMW5_HYPEX|nr:hypothetical protein BV898_09235 [Hypsibius exemplaris]